MNESGLSIAWQLLLIKALKSERSHSWTGHSVQILDSQFKAALSFGKNKKTFAQHVTRHPAYGKRHTLIRSRVKWVNEFNSQTAIWKSPTWRVLIFSLLNRTASAQIGWWPVLARKRGDQDCKFAFLARSLTAKSQKFLRICVACSKRFEFII